MTTEGRDGLHGIELIKGGVCLLGLGVAFVTWKCFKHNWLAEHGFLPEGMRDYWMVYAGGVAVLLVLGVATRFRS